MATSAERNGSLSPDLRIERALKYQPYPFIFNKIIAPYRYLGHIYSSPDLAGAAYPPTDHIYYDEKDGYLVMDHAHMNFQRHIFLFKIAPIPPEYITAANSSVIPSAAARALRTFGFMEYTRPGSPFQIAIREKERQGIPQMDELVLIDSKNGPLYFRFLREAPVDLDLRTQEEKKLPG
jgi:hypothetical protein